MPATKTNRYAYHFEFRAESGKAYSRTKRFDHKISQEESDYARLMYERQISLKNSEKIISSSCAFLGKEKFNEKYVTNAIVKYPKTIDGIKLELIKFEHQDDLWMISFDYQNIDGALIHFLGPITELWNDWWDEANACPSNETMCWNIEIIANNKKLHWLVSNDSIFSKKFTFEDLISLLGHCLTLETV
jgi:hypothetical protein